LTERGPSRSRTWLALALLLAATYFVHRSALDHEFVSWDDDINLYANPNLISGDIRWKLSWFEPYQGMWIPVTYSVWSGIAAVTREEIGLEDYSLVPEPFHAANLAFHLATTALVFFLLKRWLSSAGSARINLAALTGALAFGIHPIQVEAVHWATSMKDTLSVFLAVASMACAPTSPTRFGGRLFFAWCLFALALAAKPAVVVVPVVWLLFSIADRGRPALWTWLHFGVQLALAGLVAVIARSAQPAREAATSFGLVERLVVTLDSLGFYLLQVLTPTAFCPDYGRTPEWVLDQGVTAPLLVGCGFVALLLGCFALRKWRAGVVLLVFPAVLGPVLGLLQFSHQSISTVTDRYAYLAMLVPAYFLARLVARPKLGRAWPIALGLTVACGWLSLGAGESWQNTRALWENVIRVNPRSASAWTNLGFEHERAGRDEQAIEFYERAIKVSPTSVLAYNNIGNIHFRAERLDQAFKAYTRARRANPKDLHARNNLGAIHHRRGQLARAEALFKEVVELNPNFAPAHQNRGLVALELGEPELAELYFSEALRVDPGFKRARRGLARTQAHRGADSDARSNLSLAMGLEEDTAEFELEWAALLAVAECDADAIRAAQVRVYELGWRRPEFLAQLGLSLVEGGQPALAESVLEDALEHGAVRLDARLALARMYRESERWDEVRQLLIAAVRDDSFEPAPWHELALYHRHNGATEKASEAVRTALRLDPDHAPSRELATELGLKLPPK